MPLYNRRNSTKSGALLISWTLSNDGIRTDHYAAFRYSEPEEKEAALLEAKKFYEDLIVREDVYSATLSDSIRSTDYF